MSAVERHPEPSADATPPPVAAVAQKPVAAAPGAFSSSFVLPLTRDGHALLTRERRDGQEKYGLLGGKAHDGEDSFACAAREAKEESGDALSKVTLMRIARGAGVVGQPVAYEGAKAVAVLHDLVVKVDFEDSLEDDLVGKGDLVVKAFKRFDKKEVVRLRAAGEKGIVKKNTKKKPTEQLGMAFVPLKYLRDCEWRGKNMHHSPSVLAARLMRCV